MAFPDVVQTSVSGESTNQSSHDIVFPTDFTLTVGNTLLIAFAWDGGSNHTPVWPEGYDQEIILTQSTNVGLEIRSRVIDGTEGSGIAVTGVTNEQSAHCCYEIEDGGLIEVSTGVTSSSGNADADTVTPTGGAKDYLFITAMGIDRHEVTGFPTNCPDDQISVISSDNTNNNAASCAMASASSNAASFDPDAFANTSEQNCAVAIAVHPVAADVVITVPLKSFIRTVFTPTIASGGGAVVPLFSFEHSVFTPTVQTGVTIPVPLQSFDLTLLLPATQTGVNIAVPLESFEVASFVPIVGIGATVISPLHSFNLATFAPLFGSGINITPPLAAFTLDSFAPAVAIGVDVFAPLASFSRTAFSPVVSSGVGIVVPLQAFAIDTFTPTIGSGTTIVTPLFAFDLNTFVPAVNTGVQIFTPLFAFDFNSLTPIVGTGVDVAAPAQLFDLSAFAPSFGSGVVVDAPVLLFDLSLALPLVASGVHAITPLETFDLNTFVPVVDAEIATTRFWNEKFETSTGAGTDEAWSAGTTVGAGSLFNANYDTGLVAGAPAEWLDECLRVVKAAGEQVFIEHDFAGNITKVFIRVEVIFKSFPTALSQFQTLTLFKWADASGNDAIRFRIQERGATNNGPYVLQFIEWSTGTAVSHWDLPDAISLNTRYRLEAKLDFAGNSWEWRLNGVTKDTGTFTAGPTHVKDNLTVGFIGTGGGACEAFIDLVALDDTDWLGQESLAVIVSVPLKQYSYNVFTPVIETGLLQVEVPLLSLTYDTFVPQIGTAALVDAPTLLFDLDTFIPFFIPGGDFRATFEDELVITAEGEAIIIRADLAFIDVPLFQFGLDTFVPEVGFGISVATPLLNFEYDTFVPAIEFEHIIRAPRLLFELELLATRVFSTGISTPTALDLTPPFADIDQVRYLIKNFAVLQTALAEGATTQFETVDGKIIFVRDGRIVDVL